MVFLLSQLFLDDDAHGAGGAGDHAHSGLDAGGVQVGHLGLSDLADIFLADGGNLGLVGDTGAGLDVAGLLDEHCGGRSLGDKGEGTVGVDGDDDGDDQTDIVLGALVEFLGEAGDVNTVLTEGGADGGSGSNNVCTLIPPLARLK